MLTDAAENVTGTYTYEAFGDLLHRTGTTENSYLFTGEQYDPNAGFYYLRARYYDLKSGRFVSSDPWQGSMTDPVTLHNYQYAKANPLMYVDPSGEFSLIRVLATVSVVSALTAIVYYNPPVSTCRECSMRIYEDMSIRFPVIDSGVNNHMRHCTAMCEVSKQCPCGRTCAFLAGYANEVFGVWGWDDIKANSVGRGCYQSSSCEQCCRNSDPFGWL